MKKEKTIEQLVIKGDYNTVYLKQFMSIHDTALDTFWKRLVWLITGRLGTYMQDPDGSLKIVTHKGKNNEN